MRRVHNSRSATEPETGALDIEKWRETENPSLVSSLGFLGSWVEIVNGGQEGKVCVNYWRWGQAGK